MCARVPHYRPENIHLKIFIVNDYSSHSCTYEFLHFMSKTNDEKNEFKVNKLALITLAPPSSAYRDGCPNHRASRSEATLGEFIFQLVQ